MAEAVVVVLAAAVGTGVMIALVAWHACRTPPPTPVAGRVELGSLLEMLRWMRRSERVMLFGSRRTAGGSAGGGGSGGKRAHADAEADAVEVQVPIPRWLARALLQAHARNTAAPAPGGEGGPEASPSAHVAPAAPSDLSPLEAVERWMLCRAPGSDAARRHVWLEVASRPSSGHHRWGGGRSDTGDGTGSEASSRDDASDKSSAAAPSGGGRPGVSRTSRARLTGSGRQLLTAGAVAPSPPATTTATAAAGTGLTPLPLAGSSTRSISAPSLAGAAAAAGAAGGAEHTLPPLRVPGHAVAEHAAVGLDLLHAGAPGADGATGGVGEEPAPALGVRARLWSAAVGLVPQWIVAALLTDATASGGLEAREDAWTVGAPPPVALAEEVRAVHAAVCWHLAHARAVVMPASAGPLGGIGGLSSPSAGPRDAVMLDVGRCKFPQYRCGEGGSRLVTVLRLWQARYPHLCYTQCQSVIAAVVLHAFAPVPVPMDAWADGSGAGHVTSATLALTAAVLTFERMCDCFLGPLLHPQEAGGRDHVAPTPLSAPPPPVPPVPLPAWTRAPLYTGAEARRISAFKQALHYLDPPLAVYLTDTGLDPELFVTPFVSTLFADNVTLPDALRLFDVFVASWPDPRLPLFVVVAVLQQIRHNLLGPGEADPFELPDAIALSGSGAGDTASNPTLTATRHSNASGGAAATVAQSRTAMASLLTTAHARGVSLNSAVLPAAVGGGAGGDAPGRAVSGAGAGAASGAASVASRRAPSAAGSVAAPRAAIGSLFRTPASPAPSNGTRGGGQAASGGEAATPEELEVQRAAAALRSMEAEVEEVDFALRLAPIAPPTALPAAVALGGTDYKLTVLTPQAAAFSHQEMLTGGAAGSAARTSGVSRAESAAASMRSGASGAALRRDASMESFHAPAVRRQAAFSVVSMTSSQAGSQSAATATTHASRARPGATTTGPSILQTPLPTPIATAAGVDGAGGGGGMTGTPLTATRRPNFLSVRLGIPLPLSFPWQQHLSPATVQAPADQSTGLVLLSKLKSDGLSIDWLLAVRVGVMLWSWAPATVAQVDAWPQQASWVDGPGGVAVVAPLSTQGFLTTALSGAGALRHWLLQRGGQEAWLAGRWGGSAAGDALGTGAGGWDAGQEAAALSSSTLSVWAPPLSLPLRTMLFRHGLAQVPSRGADGAAFGTAAAAVATTPRATFADVAPRTVARGGAAESARREAAGRPSHAAADGSGGDASLALPLLAHSRSEGGGDHATGRSDTAALSPGLRPGGGVTVVSPPPKARLDSRAGSHAGGEADMDVDTDVAALSRRLWYADMLPEVSVRGITSLLLAAPCDLLEPVSSLARVLAGASIGGGRRTGALSQTVDAVLSSLHPVSMESWVGCIVVDCVHGDLAAHRAWCDALASALAHDMTASLASWLACLMAAGMGNPALAAHLAEDLRRPALYRRLQRTTQRLLQAHFRVLWLPAAALVPSPGRALSPTGVGGSGRLRRGTAGSAASGLGDALDAPFLTLESLLERCSEEAASGGEVWSKFNRAILQTCADRSVVLEEHQLTRYRHMTPVPGAGAGQRDGMAAGAAGAHGGEGDADGSPAYDPMQPRDIRTRHPLPAMVQSATALAMAAAAGQGAAPGHSHAVAGGGGAAPAVAALGGHATTGRPAGRRTARAGRPPPSLDAIVDEARGEVGLDGVPVCLHVAGLSLHTVAVLRSLLHRGRTPFVSILAAPPHLKPVV